MQRRLAVILALLLLCAPVASRVARARVAQSLAGRAQMAADARHDAPISCRANASAAAAAFQTGARLATFGRDVVSPAAPIAAPVWRGVIRSLRSARFHAKRPAARQRSSTDPPLAL
jgi:N-acetylmuramoyl-L-alanine amidase